MCCWGSVARPRCWRSSRLIPEIKGKGARPRAMAAHLGFLLGGLLLMFALDWWFER
jgi:hypothetical protein